MMVGLMIVTTAFMRIFILRKTINPQQRIAIVIVLVGIIVVSLSSLKPNTNDYSIGNKTTLVGIISAALGYMLWAL